MDGQIEGWRAGWMRWRDGWRDKMESWRDERQVLGSDGWN